MLCEQNNIFVDRQNNIKTLEVISQSLLKGANMKLDRKLKMGMVGGGP